jgi:hypothetical protein
MTASAKRTGWIRAVCGGVPGGAKASNTDRWTCIGGGASQELSEAVVERFAEQLRVVHLAGEDGVLGTEAVRDLVAHDTEGGTGDLAGLRRGDVPRPGDDERGE